MSSSPSNVKKSVFPKMRRESLVSQDAMSSDASTITRAYNIVHGIKTKPHFTESQFAGGKSVCNLPDDAQQQRPRAVDSAVPLDVPRYVEPPAPGVGIVPCGDYDVGEFGPLTTDRTYDYPLGCPACGGQMIMSCEVDGTGMVTKHTIRHGGEVRRSFDIPRFHPPDHEGRVARDIKMEDEVPCMLLGKKDDQDASSIAGTECDFETQKILFEQVPKVEKTPAAENIPKIVKSVHHQKTKADFGTIGFGSESDSEEETSVVASKVPPKPATTVAPKDDSKKSKALGFGDMPPVIEQIESSPTLSPPGVRNSTEQPIISPASSPDERRVDLAPNDSRPSEEEVPMDEFFTYERLRYNKDWKMGILANQSDATTPGCRKLEVYTPFDGNIFIDVREELITKNITSGSDLIAFQLDVTNTSFMIKPVKYYNSILSGRTRVRLGRNIQLEAIALSGCPSDSLDVLAQKGATAQIWSDMTGLMELPAMEIKKLVAADVFPPLHLFRIRVYVPHPSDAKVSWKLSRIEAILEHNQTFGDLDVPAYYWPSMVQRWDDVTVVKENATDFVLVSESFPDRKITAPRSYCRIENDQQKLTVIVVPRMKGDGNEWLALLAAPIQVAMDVTQDRLFNFIPKAFGYKPRPVTKETIDQVMDMGTVLRSGNVSMDYPLLRKDDDQLIMGLDRTSSELEDHIRRVYISLQKDH